MPTIAAAYNEVTQRISAAAGRTGRSADDVVLVAVTKTRSPAEVRAVIQAGATDLGENYVQEMVDKQQAFEASGYRELRWHAIGHLQRNKARYIAPFCTLVHSLDSDRLAEELDTRAEQAERRLPVLLEVNIAGEPSKTGLRPDAVAAVAQHVAGLQSLDLRGLMAMPPYGIAEDELRRYFAATRELAQSLAGDLPPGAMRELSMGMSHDYELAIEEGATIVRVGTAIFGPRRAEADA